MATSVVSFAGGETAPSSTYADAADAAALGGRVLLAVLFLLSGVG